MLTLLTLLCAQAEAPDLNSLITISHAPLVDHPLLQLELLSESEEFRAVLVENVGQLAYCYESSVKRHSLSGRVSMMVTITAGKVEAVLLTEDSLDAADVTSCLTRKVRGWRYPDSLTGVFNLPFVFQEAPEEP